MGLVNVGLSKAWSLQECSIRYSRATAAICGAEGLEQSWALDRRLLRDPSASIAQSQPPVSFWTVHAQHAYRLPRSRTTSSSGDVINAHWEGFADEESSIVRYQWAVGSGPRPSQQVMEFVDVGLWTNASCVTGGCLELEDGVTYVVTVRAFNGAGLIAEAVSDGVKVDGVQPTAGAVWDGDGATAHDDVSYQVSLEVLSARWSGFEDTPSGIVGYRFGVGTIPGGDDVHEFAAVPPRWHPARRWGT